MGKEEEVKIKMLSIDDRMLTTDLDRAGYRNMGIVVKLATSFHEAENSLKDGIDIIVINMDYQKIDALSVCRHFKEMEISAEIPVVITSVQTSASARKSALDAGSDLFVEQPVPRQYFVEKLKKLLEQKTRGEDRIDVKESVHLTYGTKSYHFPIGDISSSGMLVATEMDIPDGEAVEVSFLLPGYRKPIKAKCRVVRKITAEEGNLAKKISGLGIRFEKFSGDSQKRLDRYVAKTSDKEGKMIYYL